MLRTSPKIRPHYCKPSPEVVQENRLAPTGELKRRYRKIAWVLQENRLGATGESLRCGGFAWGGASRLADCQWDECDAWDAWDVVNAKSRPLARQEVWNFALLVTRAVALPLADSKVRGIA